MKKLHYLCLTFSLFCCLFSAVNAQTYCKPVGSCTYYFIANVSVGSINNTSTCVLGGYADNTSIVTDLIQGTWVAISVTVNKKQASGLVYCYIDYNHNGSFESKEYTLLSPSADNSYAGFIKIPFNAKIGLTRMRVISGASYVSSCSPSYNSESEDYGINIKPNSHTADGHVIYVKSSATGTDNSGRSWENAITSVRQAATIATPGDTIKVASGTYYSGTIRKNGIILSDSVTLLGGYPDAGSPTDANRNPGMHQTILNGLESSTPLYTNSADYHVFYANQTKSCLVDGFIIQNSGYSYGTNSPDLGRGIRIENSANIIFKNCVFTNYSESSECSAISVYNSDIKFINCIITKSKGKYNVLVEKGSKVDFINLLAVENGGEYLIEADSSQVNFRNSTIAKNVFTNTVVSVNNQSALNISNSIFNYNAVFHILWRTYNYDSVEIKSNTSVVNLRNSLMQTLRNGSNLITGNSAKFKDTSSVAGNDGFYFTADDGYTLTNPCSPALNAGSNNEANGNINDMAGQPRIFGSIVDMGAYELQQDIMPVPKVLFVNPAATGENNGNSWINAYTDLHKALQACSDTIKLAAGTYLPWQSNQSNYWLENNRVILGGYPATGNPTNADRNYDLNQTFIDGSTSNGEKAVTVMRGIGLDSTSIIDGLIITNTSNNNQTKGGALWYTKCLNPVIRNCEFTKNEIRAFEGSDNQQLQFENCKIYDNATISSYGGQLFLLTNCGETTFKNCIFQNNDLSKFAHLSYGTILTLNNTHAVIDSCMFKSNKANSLINNTSNPHVSNTQFLNNSAGNISSNLFNRHSNPIFNNCIFRHTEGDGVNYGGIMNNYISDPVFNNCQFYNGTSSHGGLAYNDSSSAKFNNCIFVNCKNTFYNTKNSNIELTNCINYGGDATNLTSGFMYNYRSSPVITNCTVTGTVLSLQPVMTNDAGSNPKIQNTVFWKNFATTPSSALKTRVEILNLNGSQPVIQNSMFEVYNAGGNNKMAEDPRFKNYLNPIGPDGIWFTADDGLQLCDCSKAINSGNNQFNQYSTDITSQPRIFDNTIDRGAYELQSIAVPIAKTAFVNSSATGNNTGLNWNDAYTNLQSAISNACIDTIKLAAGIYKPAIRDRDSIFILDHNTIMLGSYDIASGQRNVDEHPSVLSGDIGIVKDTSDNSFGLIRAVYFDSLVLDAVVLQDVNNHNRESYTNYSALNAQDLQVLTISNCRFNNNFNAPYSNPYGAGIAGMYINKLEIEKTVFSGNMSTFGGGLSLRYIGTGGAKIVNSIFSGNEGYYGGGAWTDNSGSSFINCLFTKNRATYGGAGLLLNNDPNVIITNSTFAGNLLTYVMGEGAGIRFMGSTWKTGKPSPIITNSIFTDNNYASFNGGNSPLLEIYYEEYGRPPDTDLIDINIDYSATALGPSRFGREGLISPYSIVYKNKSNPIGPDGKWFTDDDGLQLATCSNGIDKGTNTCLTLSKDLLGNERIFNTTVDLGSYEFDGKPVWAKLLNVADDSLIANKEITDSLGWTHYYTDCQYLMSIKKEGQQIGTVGDGTFNLKVVTAPAYNSGTATNLTAASYNNSGMPWYVMNRYWNIESASQLQDSILVRFPYTNGDYNDVTGSNRSLIKHEQLNFFKVNGTSNPFDLSVDSADFYNYTHGTTPSCSQWTYSKQDTVHLAEYFVKSFSGGGGGSWLNANLPDMVISAKSTSATSAGTGSNINLSFTESNLSNSIAAGLHHVQVYLSADSLITPDLNNDALLVTHEISSLNASSNITTSKELMIPCNTMPGNYYLLIVADIQNTIAETNEYNNVAFTPITITAGLTPPVTPVITSTLQGAICSGSSTTLSANAAECSSCDYTWSNGTTGNSITVTTAAEYRVTVTNVCGTASADYALVVNPSPDLSLSLGANSMCLGDSVQLTASGATSYAWSGTGLNSTSGNKVIATPSGSGLIQYTVTGTTDGCSSSQTKSITVNSRETPSVSISTSGCTGDTIFFTANPVNGGNDPQYQWYVNNTLQGTGSSYTLNGAVRGTKVYVNMISDIACASSQWVNSSVFTVSCDQTTIPAAETILVYPNPTSGLLVIDSLNLDDHWETLEVINLDNGNLVKTVNIKNQSRVILHLDYLPNGTYIILFKRADGTRAYKKFVKI